MRIFFPLKKVYDVYNNYIFYIVEEPTVGPATEGSSNGSGNDPVPSPTISDCSVPESDTTPDPSTSRIVTPVPSTTSDSGGKHNNYSIIKYSFFNA